MDDAALPDGGEAERDILPRDLPLPPPNPDGVGPTPEELVARSIAPVKAQYICTPPPRPRLAPDTGNGAEGVGEDKAASTPLSVVKETKSKRQLKRERKQEKESVLNICPHIAKSGNVDACRFGSNCRFNHDLGAFLAQKPADLEGICPFLSFEKPCPYGVSCRFFNTHKKSDSLETKDPSTKSSEINNLKKEVQKLLWKNKFKFPKADAELKLRGLMGPNNAKEQPEDNQAKSHLTRSLNGSNTLHADSDSEIPCSTADGMECAPTVCLDKEFSDVAPVVEELRPSKKAKDQADEELCCNETDAGISRMEKDFEELNAQDGLEENIIDSSCLSESELILKPHMRERKLIDFRGKLYLAPLTTVGNLPFRRICKVLGADITCGEMAMCTNLLQGQASEWALLRRHSSEDLFGVQICGAYPDTITRTAELIDQECTVDFIDINMGCPIDIVVNKGAGSSLLTKPMRIKNIAQSASSTISKPITLKVRTGYFEGRNRIDSLISDISHWGVSALTVHGRSRQQRYSKLADWDYIYQCAKKSPDVMQILGNGDIFSYVDWNKHTSECPELSSCMIARGALIKPWLFTEIKEQRHWDISSCERLNIFKDYVNFGLEHWGSDTKGVETTRHFLLEWLSYTHRYVPVGLLEVIPQRINWRSPGYVGRDDLETLMASDSAADWVRISELLLGKVPEGFTFAPKHKSNAYDRTENG